MPQVLQFNKNLLCVTGLPRSGSTLLCQLLAHHPELYVTGHSSPLCQAITGLRQHLSDHDFLRAQLDVDFDLAYQRLMNTFRGLLMGWFTEAEEDWVIDKNRGWLHHLELLHALTPNFRMLVCVRELGQIYGSIEAQHQKTILLDFPDHLANYSRYGRADQLFANQGVIGSPLQSIAALQDIEQSLQKNLFYVVFEDLMQDPVKVMDSIFQWLEIDDFTIDPQNLDTSPHESDSYYRFKYLHRTRNSITPPHMHQIPQRIQTSIQNNFDWYYQIFYPGIKL